MSIRAITIALVSSMSLSLGCAPKTNIKDAPQEAKAESSAPAMEVGKVSTKDDAPEVSEKKTELADEMNGGDGAPNEMPEVPANGEYTNTHGVLVDPESDTIEDATDCLTINLLGSGSVEFELALQFDMEHSCELSGEADPKTNGQLVYTGSKATDDEGCTLVIVTKDDTITLEDEGMKCSPVWCGARGTIDGATFARSTKREATGKCGG